MDKVTSPTLVPFPESLRLLYALLLSFIEAHGAGNPVLYMDAIMILSELRQDLPTAVGSGYIYINVDGVGALVVCVELDVVDIHVIPSYPFGFDAEPVLTVFFYGEDGGTTFDPEAEEYARLILERARQEDLHFMKRVDFDVAWAPSENFVPLVSFMVRQHCTRFPHPDHQEVTAWAKQHAQMQLS